MKICGIEMDMSDAKLFPTTLAEKDTVIRILNEKLSQCVYVGRYNEKCKAVFTLAKNVMELEKKSRQLTLIASSERDRANTLECLLQREKEEHIACLDMVAMALDIIQKNKAEAHKDRLIWSVTAGIVSKLLPTTNNELIMTRDASQQWNGTVVVVEAEKENGEEEKAKTPTEESSVASSFGDVDSDNNTHNKRKRRKPVDEQQLSQTKKKRKIFTAALLTTPTKKQYHLRSTSSSQSLPCNEHSVTASSIGAPKTRRFMSLTKFIDPSLASISGIYFPKRQQKNKNIRATVK